MRRLIAVTLVAPAILAAAENVKAPLLDRALTRGVTNDRPYLPTSRIEVSYQAARALVARNESLLMAGTLTSVPQSEISAVRAALDNEVRAAGSITEHERHQYEEAQRDLDALVSAMASIGLGVNAAPATLVQAPAVETPAAETPAAPTAAPVNEAPVETAPAAAPVVEKPAETAAPVEAPAVEKPAEAPAVEAPAAEKPVETPAETPAVEAPAAEKPAETPAEAPAAEKPAETPAEVPAAEKPADAPAEAPAAEKPADNALPPE